VRRHSYLSLGSNLGDPVANLRACIERLGDLGEVRQISSFYSTEPMELREQPWFVNCAIELETELTAGQLLAGVQTIEAGLGRVREISKGPRTIDIDILLFGSSVIQEGTLQIPHPAMHERRFVLAPLTEIAPNVMHPILQKTATEILSQLGTAGGVVKRLASR
jgi:2-amino-4-hydroxy-6-hydroxymethyldihydropteridine diphosphokinase